MPFPPKKSMPTASDNPFQGGDAPMKSVKKAKKKGDPKLSAALQGLKGLKP